MSSEDELDVLVLAPPPRPPVTVAPPEPLEEDEEEDDELPLTVVPTAPLTAVTVPAIGARRVVAATSFSALVTLSCALSRLACAAATVMVLVAPEPEEDELPPALFAAVAVVAAVVVVLAAVSAWSSASCADCRLASAWASATLAASGSTLARSSSRATCWPALT